MELRLFFNKLEQINIELQKEFFGQITKINSLINHLANKQQPNRQQQINQINEFKLKVDTSLTFKLWTN